MKSLLMTTCQKTSFEMWFFTVTKNMINLPYAHYLSHPYLMPSNNTFMECFPTFQGIFLCDTCANENHRAQNYSQTHKSKAIEDYSGFGRQVSFQNARVDMDCASTYYTVINNNQCELRQVVENILHPRFLFCKAGLAGAVLAKLLRILEVVVYNAPVLPGPINRHGKWGKASCCMTVSCSKVSH